MIQVLHFRFFNSDRSINPCGGITYALELNEEKKAVRFATAICHHKDNFVRRTGHVKAVGRLNSPKQSHSFGEPVDVAQFIEDVRINGIFDVKGRKK